MTKALDDFTAFGEELARASGELIMGHYRSLLTGGGPEIERKADATPVTVADQGAEALMRGMIESRFPEHKVMGEEGGASGKLDATLQWVLDPIDGTKPFIHGVPLFGTLIALLDEGEPLMGVIHLPAVGELMIGAAGRPTTVNGRTVRVRETATMGEATVLYTDIESITSLDEGQALQRFFDGARLMRGWGDCYGHFMVASGRADVMIDPELSFWDLAALKPCVEGAGGRFSDLSGNTKGLGTSGISSNGLLHEETLRILRG